MLEVEIEPGMRDGQEYPFVAEGELHWARGLHLSLCTTKCEFMPHVMVWGGTVGCMWVCGWVEVREFIHACVQLHVCSCPKSL